MRQSRIQSNRFQSFNCFASPLMRFPRLACIMTLYKVLQNKLSTKGKYNEYCTFNRSCHAICSSLCIEAAIDPHASVVSEGSTFLKCSSAFAFRRLTHKHKQNNQLWQWNIERKFHCERKHMPSSSNLVAMITCKLA